MSHEAVHSLSYATFFRHLAVLSLKALLSHNVSNIHSLTSGKYFKSRLQQWNNITPFECNSSKVIRYFTINGTNSLFCFVFAFLCLCFVLFFICFALIVQELTLLADFNLKLSAAAAASSSRRTKFCSSLQFLTYKMTARTVGISISFHIRLIFLNDVERFDRRGGNGFNSSLTCDSISSF